jgi:glutamate dehydrogenase
MKRRVPASAVPEAERVAAGLAAARRVAAPDEPGARGDAAQGDLAPEDLAAGDLAPGDVAPGDLAPGDVAPGGRVEAEDIELDEPLPDAERLIADAVSLAGSDLDSAHLVRRYWRFAPDEELVGLTPDQMLAEAKGHRELAEQRLPGQLKLRVGETPDGELTVVEIVTDDMPFLVDTVTAALVGHGLFVHLMVHPQVVVQRQPLGRLLEVHADVEPDDAIAGDLVESWMRVEIDRVPESAHEQLRRDLQRVLTDVREAVEDWPRMRAQALQIADELGSADLPVPARDITDSVELLRWLADDHFTFLGYREYRLRDGADGLELAAVLGTGLGILRQDQTNPRVLATLPVQARTRVLEKRLLVITKANSRSTVHRSSYLDYVGIKVFNADGNVIGERRFLGLFSAAAYLHSVRELPVVKRKVSGVLERSGLSPRSHSGKDLLAILEDYPRDELFQIRTDELYDAVMGVLRLAGRRQLRVFLREDAYGRFISCLVYLPRDRYTTANRLAIQEILLRELNGVGVDYTTRVGESLLARIHFIVRTDPNRPPVIDVPHVQELLADATRNWDDDFRLVLERKLGEEQARQLFARYCEAFPEAYKDEHTPYEAVQDIAKMELLDEPGQLAMHLYRRRKDDRDVRFKVFRHDEPMILSTVLPVLHSLGVQVSDERPYRVARGQSTVYIYDFGLVFPDAAREMPVIRAQVENAFSAAWHGEAEVDGLNELVVRAGLTWRQVVILRAYAKYLRQAGTVFSDGSIVAALVAYPDITAMLVALFESRFSPAGLSEEDRSVRSKELVGAVGQALDQVASLDQDRILRSFLTLVEATLRTSFYQRATSTEQGTLGRPKSYVAFKLQARAIPELPAPRPAYEIWVYSPRFEGLHLRFGPVARGGIRWSDRRDDFRTEILGLVKAQSVKNAVIVPVGAKGGFVLKAATSRMDREALQAEGVACYRLFISALLDVTDNLVNGAVVGPPDVVCHDGDDTYLVVAADKGTASFSDIANEISVAHGFWLDDAFASGGSAGYDHKKMGITARGAWESVRRHMRELDLDIETQTFTAVGIGDMSGDVFGNGMLLSRHIKLVAAFDHRHVFVDPSPDPETSYVERERLFGLPRSSWADYDTSLISPGGGVWPRTAKSVPVSAQARAALGLPPSATALSPAELIRAILQAPVDLLWNGGIGTYVKATAESHVDAGDKTNDAVRINGDQVRARVVGEGGNLGLTQRGRVQYAMTGGPDGSGGRICTDSIDNAAGVDCSDHEVNIKILLRPAELGRPERDALLAEMTDEVAALVLRDNYDQATALGNARAQANSMLPVHRRMISDLEREGRLDRALEALPTDEELAQRSAAGGGLCSPEFAVLLSYVKIALEHDISGAPLPEEAWTRQVLLDYFPTPLRDRYAELMQQHPLHREIVTTKLVNEVVNRGGTSFVYRAVEETGASAADVLRAYVIVREVYGLRDLWQAVERLDNRVPVAAQTAVYLAVRRLMDRAVRWLVTNRRAPLDVSAEIARLGPGIARLLPSLATLFRGRERESLSSNVDRLVDLGIPRDVADLATRIEYGFGLMDIVLLADTSGHGLTEVAEVYFALSEHFRVDDLLSRISELPRADRWQTLARMALRYDLYAALAGLSAEVLSTDGVDGAEQRVAVWEHANETVAARARRSIEELGDAPADLAALSVLLRHIRTLVRTAAS